MTKSLGPGARSLRLLPSELIVHAAVVGLSIRRPRSSHPGLVACLWSVVLAWPCERAHTCRPLHVGRLGGLGVGSLEGKAAGASARGVRGLLQADVALLAPGAAPRVLNLPVAARVVVADRENAVVELGAAAEEATGVDTTGVELPASASGVNGDRDGLARDGGLEAREGLGGNVG